MRRIRHLLRLIPYAVGFCFLALAGQIVFAQTDCTPLTYTSPNDYFALSRGTMDGTETCVVGLNSSETPTIRIVGTAGVAYGGPAISAYAYLPGNQTVALSNFTINATPVADSTQNTSVMQGVYIVEGSYTYSGYTYTLHSVLTFSNSGAWTVAFNSNWINTVSLLPEISAVSPTVGPTTGGTEITIEGSKFTGTTGVTINGVAATDVTVIDDTTVTAVTPSSESAGAVTVAVTNASGTGSASSAFTYGFIPVVSSITPNTGLLAGGTSVTISGSYFTGATSVTIGGTVASSVTVVDDSTITATTPAGTAGAADVVVTTQYGSGTGSNLFTYGSAPTVSSISPSTGTIAGGTAVTITGANLTGTTGVTIGGNAATSVSVVNSTTVTAVTPVGTAGVADVVVTTALGSATGSSLFTYSNPRGDPTRDAVVRGAVGTQSMAAQQFTTTQITHVFNHLSELHERFDPVAVDKIHFQLNMANAPGMAWFFKLGKVLLDLKKGIEHPKLMQTPSPYFSLAKNLFQSDESSNALFDSAFLSEVMGSDAPSVNEAIFGNSAWRLWGAGQISVGSLNDSNGDTNHFSTSGVTLGLDHKSREDLIVGGALGFGTDRTSFDGYGSGTKSALRNWVLYLTYQPLQKWYVDAMFGYGRLAYKNKRWVSADNVMLSGTRYGRAVFGSLAFTNLMRFGQWHVDPYLREDITSTRLFAYQEDGSVTYALNYDKSDQMSYGTSLGTKAYYDHVLQAAMLRGLIDLQYLRTFKGNITQGMYYTETGAGGGYYNLSSISTPQIKESLGVGLIYQRNDGLRSELFCTGALGTNAYRAYILRAQVSQTFG